ncbi:nicotinate-nucleotide--dimethylbenzimidazole phosphoribosyltransferase [Ktedonospora formicarum]
MEQLREQLTRIQPLDKDAIQQATQRQQQLTKPAGSLGRLEEIAIRLAGIQGTPIPKIQRRDVIVMAADHGVTREGVSAYPAEVTPQMVLNFLSGGAAINALARQAEAAVSIVDVGVATELHHPQLIERKIALGSANMVEGPALTSEQLFKAIQVGFDVLDEIAHQGSDLVAIGEMGIGNTTAASAISATLLQQPVEALTGYGTGINEQQRQHKIQVLQRAVQQNQPDPHDPLDVLAKVGGLEIAALTGVVIAAAAHRIPVLIDGFISSSAALIACALQPRITDYLFAGHASVEPGHRLILAQLGLTPLLSLDMRLGEGTGAVLAMHILEAALRTHREMATFADAGVSERTENT